MTIELYLDENEAAHLVLLLEVAKRSLGRQYDMAKQRDDEPFAAICAENYNLAEDMLEKITVNTQLVRSSKPYKLK